MEISEAIDRQDVAIPDSTTQEINQAFIQIVDRQDVEMLHVLLSRFLKKVFIPVEVHRAVLKTIVHQNEEVLSILLDRFSCFDKSMVQHAFSLLIDNWNVPMMIQLLNRFPKDFFDIDDVNQVFTKAIDRWDIGGRDLVDFLIHLFPKNQLENTTVNRLLMTSIKFQDIVILQDVVSSFNHFDETGIENAIRQTIALQNSTIFQILIYHFPKEIVKMKAFISQAIDHRQTEMLQLLVNHFNDFFNPIDLRRLFSEAVEHRNIKTLTALLCHFPKDLFDQLVVNRAFVIATGMSNQVMLKLLVCHFPKDIFEPMTLTQALVQIIDRTDHKMLESLMCHFSVNQFDPIAVNQVLERCIQIGSIETLEVLLYYFDAKFFSQAYIDRVLQYARESEQIEMAEVLITHFETE